MTLHSAKGLEFPVYLAGMEDGLFRTSYIRSAEMIRRDGGGTRLLLCGRDRAEEKLTLPARVCVWSEVRDNI